VRKARNRIESVRVRGKIYRREKHARTSSEILGGDVQER
jgi:hypothetical protein